MSEYFRTLGFTSDNASKREKALNRAYQLRTFEIEHYWKRANYFWGFQIVIFAAFGLLGKEIVQHSAENTTPTERLWNLVLVALSVLGALTAVANLLSARGSKFWQQNWERHIDMLEDDIEGSLHKTVWITMIPFSVSRVNQTLSAFFVVFWILVTSYVACTLDFLKGVPSCWQLMIAIAVIMLGIVVSLALNTSDLRGLWPDGKRFNQWSWWCNRRDESRQFIRRPAPVKDKSAA